MPKIKKKKGLHCIRNIFQIYVYLIKLRTKTH